MMRALGCAVTLHQHQLAQHRSTPLTTRGARGAIPARRYSAGGISIFIGVTLTVPDLNTRETAMLVWIVLTLAVALAIPSGRGIVIEGVKIAARPFVTVLLAATTLLAATITMCLAWFGYWRTSMIPATVAWFVGTAIVGTFSTGGVGELRRLVARTVALTAVVEFVSNAYALPLPAELIIVPIVVCLITLASFADRRPEFANTRTPFKVLCIALFVGTLTPTIIYAVQHLGRLASAEQAREFLLPLVLTVAFIPYLYLVRMVIAWQTVFSMLKSLMQDRPSLLSTARRALIRSCHVSLPRIQLFEPEFRWRLAAATSEADIQCTMRDFNRAVAERPWRKRRGAEERAHTSAPPCSRRSAAGCASCARNAASHRMRSAGGRAQSSLDLQLRDGLYGPAPYDNPAPRSRSASTAASVDRRGREKCRARRLIGRPRSCLAPGRGPPV